MAVTFKTDAKYGESILDLFGVPPSVKDAATVMGVTFEMTVPGSFTVKGPKGTTVVPIKAQAISLAKAGSLGPASSDSIKGQLIGAVAHAIGSKFTPEQLTSKKATLPTSEKVKQEILKNMLGKPVIMAGSPDISGVSIAADGTATFSGVKAGTLAQVGAFSTTSLGDLSSAHVQVGQPVKGTSKSSVYYVVAKLQGLNLAIRSKNNSLSIRAAGDGMKHYAPQLQELGFKVSTDYSSVHFECTGAGIMLKTVGAVLGRLGLSQLIQTTDVSKLLGKA